MSKLPNAPLLEVIFELHWNLRGQSDLIKYQYLHGDLYNALKTDFPFRESLTPPEVPLGALLRTISHRFRKAEQDYPLIQLGPGVLTVNTIDEIYYWEQYYEMCERIIETFFSIYTGTDKTKFRPSLIYTDFFELDISSKNAFEFLNTNFDVSISQNFYKTSDLPTNLNFGFKYKTEAGTLSLNFDTGKKGHVTGIVCNTRVVGPEFASKPPEIFDWLNKAHTLSRELFVKMTRDHFYKTFQ